MSFLLSLLMLLLLLSNTALQLVASSSSKYELSKPGCQEQCGNIKIPFPFGIGSSCSYSSYFEITCDTSFHPPKPSLRMFRLEIMDISWKGRNPRLSNGVLENEQIILVGTPLHDMCKSNSSVSINLGGSPYRLSSWFNVLVVKGCGGRVVMKNKKGDVLLSCATLCVNDTTTTSMNKDCHGIGCCQVSFVNKRYDINYQFQIQPPLDFYQLDLEQEASELGSSSCNMSAALIDSRYVNKFVGDTVVVPTLLKWTANSDVQASCPPGYEGNPFLSQGCQVLKECRKCRHSCISTFNPAGQVHFHCPKYNFWSSIYGFVGICMIGGLVLLFCFYILYYVVKAKQEARRKSENFKRNGGFLLKQQLMSSGDAADAIVFPVKELEKATDNFNRNRILGEGGQGTVYKGMLKDGSIVAIKKSKNVDKDQLEQFINEVVILSQINHRNVVKLLGCCLETEVPLLLYEFIPNGTLSQHIHDASEDDDFHLTWKMRLQVAVESANAIAYLHSSSSTPIYHRDIKSSNILLDSKFRAKVSDFGISKAINIEQTHVSTRVIGTDGYLDPEYLHLNRFTDKSDVYSFGVVLVELITGKIPRRRTDAGWINLASEFLSHMENSSLSDFLDDRILDEGKEEEFIAVADLARNCLKMRGNERPTMKEIAILLEEIRSSVEPMQKSTNGNGIMMANDHEVSGSSSTNSFVFDVAGLGASFLEMRTSEGGSNAYSRFTNKTF